jgi:hypothetical protein
VWIRPSRRVPEAKASGRRELFASFAQARYAATSALVVA